MIRDIRSYLWKYYDDYNGRNAGDKERPNPFKDGVHGDIFRHPLEYENIQTHRRGDQPHFQDDDHNDTEPDSIKSHGSEDREKNRNGQNDHGKSIHDAAQYDIKKEDCAQNDKSVHFKSLEIISKVHGKL